MCSCQNALDGVEFKSEMPISIQFVRVTISERGGKTFQAESCSPEMYSCDSFMYSTPPTRYSPSRFSQEWKIR